MLVLIRGLAIANPSGVTFGGVSSSFSAISETEIVATVPPLALTGPIRVTTPDGTATSSIPFTVSP